MLRYLEVRLASFQDHIRRNGGREQHFAVAITEDLAKLHTAMHFAALNSDGFRKILKKFDKRTGCGASPAAMADLHRLGFFLDNSVFGSGRFAALSIALHDLLRAARGPP